MWSKIIWILNLSPDSFSDGRIYSHNELENRIQNLIDNGADIIDIGAESTAPGSKPITLEEELRRLGDFFKIQEKFQNSWVQFSLDTKKSLVAKTWIENWISLINDVSWGRADSDMYSVIASNPTTQYVVMYSKNADGHADLYEHKNPQNIIKTVIDFFDATIPRLLSEGIQKEQIILDPGMGSFISTDPADSIRILQSLPLLKERYHLPFLIGTSRKGFLNKISPDKWPQDRLASSIVSSLFASIQGADYLRVHDVYEMRQAWRMWDICTWVDSIQNSI